MVFPCVNDTASTMYLTEGLEVGTAMGVEEGSTQKGQKSCSSAAPKVQRTRVQDELPQHLVDLFEKSSEGLDDMQKDSLRTLLIEFQDVFAAHDLDLGCFTAAPHRVRLAEGAEVFRERMRRTPRGFEGEEERHLTSMLEAGVIQPSESPWASAPVLIRKKDGGVRWCVDYRRLNAITVKDAFPLPLISDCLESLAENQFMSTLDMASGYWQVGVHPGDRDKTAFITKYGLFEFIRMPFGLTNAPSTFQRAMTLVLRGLTWKSVLAFLDDVLVLGKDFQDHLDNLRSVLERFRQFQLKLKPKKCALFQKRVKFLGKIVGEGSVGIDPENFKAVVDWPRPKCTRDVESFLGFVNYHREHIPNMAEAAIPLYALTGKAPFKWEDSEERAFKSLKEKLLSAEVLALPQNEGMFVLDMDASNEALGGCLSQWQGEVLRPVFFSSKRLTPLQ